MHVLEHLMESEGYSPDILVFLQCTSPLTLPEDIAGTIQTLQDQNADSALAATPFHYFLWKNHDGNAEGINHHKKYRPLRQERDPQYLETGAVYALRVEGFWQAKHRFFGKTALYTMPMERCFEIDEPIDLQIAEVLMRNQQRQIAIQELPEPLEALVLDFDGVFTDNKVIVLEDGREAIIADRGDGWGVAQLKQHKLPVLVLSTEKNPVVQARCDKLGIACIHGVNDKWPRLQDWLAERHINPAQVVYVGNDLNDLACIQRVGCGIVVADAHPKVRPAAQVILDNPGGSGAVREVTDLILQHLEK